jgi:hypothetical protein
VARLAGLSRPDLLRRAISDPDRSVGLEAMLAMNALSERFARALQTELDSGREEAVVIRPVLPELERALGLRIEAAPEVAGILRIPLPLSGRFRFDSLLQALARESDFTVGLVYSPERSTLRILPRGDALLELRRLLGTDR